MYGSDIETEDAIDYLSVYKYNKKSGKLEKDKWLKRDETKKEKGSVGDIDYLENYETKSGVSAVSIAFQMGEFSFLDSSFLDGFGIMDYQMINCYSQWISGSAFEALLEEVMETKIESPDELLMLGGKKFVEKVKMKYEKEQGEKFSNASYSGKFTLEHIMFIAKETEDAFYGINLQGEARLLYVKDNSKKDVSFLMDKVKEYKVTGVGYLGVSFFGIPHSGPIFSKDTGLTTIKNTR